MSCNSLTFGIQHSQQARLPRNPDCNQNSVGMPRFVVQEHYARTHHFDFRLERDGVYKSWAVPKGMPEGPGVKRLAIKVEDHDVSFGDFEGQISEGQYGAGRVQIWDAGSYDPHLWTDSRILLTLYGRRLVGDYTLFRFTRGKPNEWLVLKSSESLKPSKAPPKSD
jgi:DNA ligase D-like protein (predicted 3'-phosphoesterase)